MSIKRLMTAAILTISFLAGCSKQPDIGGTGLVRVADGVYAWIATGTTSAEGLGANAGFIVGEEAVLVVDSRFSPGHARSLLDAVRSVTDLPLRYVVNTHYHPEHVWGNSVFRDEGAIVLARPETGIEMEKYTPIYQEYYKTRKPDVYRMIKDVKAVPPDSLVTDDTVIDLGGLEAEITFAGPAHTAGDLIVAVPSRGVVFTGGLVSNGYHPNMGDQQADFGNWLKALDEIEASDPGTIVPGQGRAGGTEMIDAHRSYMVDLMALTADAIRRGRTLSKSILEIKVPGTEGYEQANILPFNIQAIYRKKALEVVSPRAEMDIPTGFVISDAAGGPDAGLVQWILQSDEGYYELELSWQPSSRTEILLVDIHDKLARYEASEDGLYDMEIAGSRKLIIGGDTVPAAHGTWTYKQKVQSRGAGRWSWTMVLAGGKVYSVRMLTNTGGDEQLEERNIATLEQVASTLRMAAP